MLQRLKDMFRLGVMGATPRSGKWAKVRAEHLRVKDKCSVCGGIKDLTVHHIKPFHLFPDLELDPTNLISLCEGNPVLNCHLFVGHLGSFKSWNPDVVKDANDWRIKIANRL